jgi:dihydroorotate dehydrogenase
MPMLNHIYKTIRPLVFMADAERAHNAAMQTISIAPGIIGALAGNTTPHPSLARTVAGLKFLGPVGLAAGLDKNGEAATFWPSLGFGFIELGTVTALPQVGNPKPRLFRIPKERAIINRMGFNNHGSEALANRLRVLRESGNWPLAPVGANIGKSKVTPLADAAGDYALSTDRLAPLVDYLTVNVSSPNTPGLRELQGKEPLKRILDGVLLRAQQKPVFLKLAPDLSDSALEEAVELAISIGTSGIIATNTTITRPGNTGVLDESGGLSGAPLASLAKSKIQTVLNITGSRVPVIAVGGIHRAAQVQELLDLGASAVQIYSALIYEGPMLPAQIHKVLARNP